MSIRSLAGLITWSAALIISAGALCSAQGPPPVPTPAPSKIAFVNLQEAVTTCNEGKQVAAALTQRFADKKNALKALDDELQKLKADYQVADLKLNESDRAARQKAIQDKQKVFDRTYADYQSETQEAQQEAVNGILKKMLPVLEKYVAANGYTAVFDVANPQSAPVLWVRKDALITKQLIEAYDAVEPRPALGSRP
jgi:Skp family chaperone for outer membrane proteins